MAVSVYILIYVLQITYNHESRPYDCEKHIKTVLAQWIIINYNDSRNNAYSKAPLDVIVYVCLYINVCAILNAFKHMVVL